jgi:serine/threonine protein kinase
MRVVEKYKAIIEEIQQSIINLAKIGGKLTHPSIAKQYRIFSDQYRIYFLSRWVEG